jgi:hypothetical protein
LPQKVYGSKYREQQRMFSMIESWKGSNESQQSFCKTTGISLSGFQYWLKKYRDQKDLSQPSTFIPVKIQADSLESPFADLVLPDGRRLTLYHAVDCAFLRSLLS